MPNSQANNKSAVKFYFIALVVLILDQITKYYFNSTFDLHETVDVIPSLLNWTLAYNHGAAFSFLADQSGWQKYLFAILGISVAFFITYYLRQIPRTANILSLGLSLVLGGAIGNVIDRFIYGHVIDFIHVHYANVWHYPIFNIADIAIVLGMVLVVFDMLILEKKRNTPPL